MTFNRRVTEGIQDGTIEETTKDGVRVYLVRRPQPGEVVVRYTNFSDLTVPKTITEQSSYEAKFQSS